MNTSFLELVAKDIYEKLDGDFTKTTVIFPNKRASLFLNSHLASLSDKPMWTPTYMSISELFASLSNRTVCDPIKSVCRLYESFIRQSGKDESLDKFYSWGEMMLSDFEDIDNNLADAEKLFANISDLEAMTDFSHLSENQIKAIQQFFENFEPDNRTKLKEKFLSVWDALYPTYKDFKESLLAENLCYEGMMKREIVQDIKVKPEEMLAKLKGETYVIIGFNVLNKTERKLFQFLKENKNTFFYWDYDEVYRDFEAGRFIKEDIAFFGNQFDGHPEYYRNFKKKKNIRFIASPTENAQSRFVSQWINDTINPKDKLNESAIVLCNESILPSVLHSIPPVLGNNKPVALNVTMGFPITNTPVYSLIQQLMELQIYGRTDNGYWRYTQVSNILRHPFVRKITKDVSFDMLGDLRDGNNMFPSDEDLKKTAFLSQIFEQKESSMNITAYLSDILKTIGASYKGEKDATLQKESIFSAYTIINRIHSLQEEDKVFMNIGKEMLYRLIRQIMGSHSIPFHGEPAIGLQVMGVLETRNLDFKNVILLSCNENMLPKNVKRASLIPYNLREAHEMTTMEKQVSLYAYYFYNLLQRAENITIMYNSSTEGLNKGEMSRFMMQLDVERKKILGNDTDFQIMSLGADNDTDSVTPVEVIKSEKLMKKMAEHFKDKPLSPSAINTFLNCPLQFYFKHVAGMKETEQVTEDVDNPTFGNIFHKSMELIYSPYIGRQLQSSTIKALAEDEKKIELYVDEAFKKEFFKNEKKQNRYNGQQLLNRYMIIKYVKNQLLHDAKNCPMTIRGVEKYVQEIVTIDKYEVKLGGIIDRMEILSSPNGKNYLQITDYKTGSNHETSTTEEKMADGNAHFMLQAFYYSSIIVGKEDTDMPVKPMLMYVALPSDSRANALTYNGQEVLDFASINDAYKELLTGIIRRIYDKDIPFTQCKDNTKCTYCAFANFCKRR